MRVGQTFGERRFYSFRLLNMHYTSILFTLIVLSTLHYAILPIFFTLLMKRYCFEMCWNLVITKPLLYQFASFFHHFNMIYFFSWLSTFLTIPGIHKWSKVILCKQFQSMHKSTNWSNMADSPQIFPTP